MDSEPDIFGQRQQTLSELLQHAERVIDVGSLCSGRCQLDVRVCDSALDQLSQTLRIAQVENAYPAAPKLVLIRRPNPAPGRPDFLARRALAIDKLVIRQDEVGAVADVQAALHVDAVRNELIDLRK